jgi:hypothetical protein
MFRSKSWPWVISIALHVVVLAAIGVWAYRYYEGGKESQKRGGAGEAAEARHSTEAMADRNIDLQDKLAASKPADEKLEELKERLDALDEIYIRDVRAAADFVEARKGVKQDRWYKPNPEVKGKFESSSATLYDVTRRVKNGKTVYVHTLVDAEGRSAKAEIPEEQMSVDQMRAFQVFEIARRNPKLRYLVDTALRIGENMVREGSRE